MADSKTKEQLLKQGIPSTVIEDLVRKGIDLTQLRTLLDSLAPFHDYTPNPFPKEKTIEVPMGGLEVTTAIAEKPYIGTASLASCAGIAIYDAQNKIGGVAHVFFNEKESMTIYQRDAQGREIPSSGRSIIVNNPFWYSPFSQNANQLIAMADARGGSNYQFTAFNIHHGCRTRKQNEKLVEIVDGVIATLQANRKITTASYRTETAFVVNTITGQIVPY